MQKCNKKYTGKCILEFSFILEQIHIKVSISSLSIFNLSSRLLKFVNPPENI